jgi:purine-binding chemotaxis protein CheW
MQLDESPIGANVMAMRRAFDASFSVTTSAETTAFDELLAIGVGQGHYAVRRADVSALVVDKAVTPLPGTPPAFLGIAAFRGRLIPVYDLRGLLGEDRTAQPRWLVLGVSEPRYGLAFDRFERYLRVACDAIVARDDSTVPHLAAHELVLHDGEVRPIVHMPSATRAITTLVAGHGSGRKQ